MKSLWAPWRVSFISSKKEEGCIFCNKPSERDDMQNLILERREMVFCMLNKFPYNSGHILVAPYRHVCNFDELKIEEWADMLRLLQDSIKILKAQMRPEGYNIGFNVGKASGAGFDHLHLHIVPRWVGDTNFMPVLSETKVIPEHIEATYNSIREGFSGLNK